MLHPSAPATLPRVDQARIIPDMGVVSNGWLYFFNRRVTGLRYSISGRLFKNDELQGARTLRNAAYNPVRRNDEGDSATKRIAFFNGLVKER